MNQLDEAKDMVARLDANQHEAATVEEIENIDESRGTSFLYSFCSWHVCKNATHVASRKPKRAKDNDMVRASTCSSTKVSRSAIRAGRGENQGGHTHKLSEKWNGTEKETRVTKKNDTVTITTDDTDSDSDFQPLSMVQAKIKNQQSSKGLRRLSIPIIPTIILNTRLLEETPHAC